MAAIASEIDLDADGKHVGHLRLPHSVHRSAYGYLPIPIASVRNGDGPVVLVMAGNHGDEYEGQVLVSQLVREVDPRWVRGQLILLPTANAPAAAAGTRTSPIDGGNLNRSFPGDAAGGPTSAIAHYIEHELLARADYFVDLHSGGTSLLYDGANLLTVEPDEPAEAAQLRALLAAFGLPRAFLHGFNPALASGAARRQGAVAIVAELGGGAVVRPPLLRQARQGLLHFLGHVGVLAGPLVPAGPPAVARFFRVSPRGHYVHAQERGVFEPLVELGQTVSAGEPAARIHFPHAPLRDPVVLRFEGAGEVVCQRALAAVEHGDCLFHLAAPIDA